MSADASCVVEMIVFSETHFSAHQLERSMPFDFLRIMSGEKGRAFADQIAELLLANERRVRNRRNDDMERWRHSLSVLLANLAIAIFNRVDSRRFVAISLNRNDYIGCAVSVKALHDLLECLVSLGLVEGQRGYRDFKNGQVRHSRRTRIRASKSMFDLFLNEGIARKDVGWSERRDIIILREPDISDLTEPSDVYASRTALSRINTAISQTQLWLPDDAWARVTERYKMSGNSEVDRLVSGEEASTLYRIFKGGWDRGGRLYGGWWINLPKIERALLKLDGQPVVERDFARLHPTLLFARVGIELNFDIYSIDGINGPYVRELGKRTFNRLINRSASGFANLAPKSLDLEQLPPGVKFRTYLNAFTDRLMPIARWFGTGEGLRLQREDSDLALSIVNRLLDQNIIALPVHDSFIVCQHNEPHLIDAMQSEFRTKYGFTPVVR